jgi:hypothetical protein
MGRNASPGRLVAKDVLNDECPYRDRRPERCCANDLPDRQDAQHAPLKLTTSGHIEIARPNRDHRCTVRRACRRPVWVPGS